MRLPEYMSCYSFVLGVLCGPSLYPVQRELCYIMPFAFSLHSGPSGPGRWIPTVMEPWVLAVFVAVDSDGFFHFCYYDTEQGETSWFAPDGSSPSFMYDQADFSHPVFMRNLPPPLPAKATVGSPTNTGWFVLFVDAIDKRRYWVPPCW